MPALFVDNDLSPRLCRSYVNRRSGRQWLLIAWNWPRFVAGLCPLITVIMNPILSNRDTELFPVVSTKN